MLRAFPCLLFLTVCVSIAPCPAATAAERQAAELFPSSTLLYLELATPGELIDVLLKHPLRDRVVALDPYQQALESPQMREFQQVLQHVETRLGMSWQTAIRALTVGGIHVGVDAGTEGVGLLIRARDAETVEKIRDEFIRLARLDASDKDAADPIRSRDYRGINAFQLNKAVFATLDDWLLIVNKGELGKAIVDRYLDGGEDCLAQQDRFREAVANRHGSPTVWAYANVEALRDAGVAKDLFAGRTENPAAELLVGGVMSTLQSTPFVTAELLVKTDHVDLAVMMPQRPDWIPAEREFFFGPDGQGSAPPPPTVRNRILALSTYRDISEMWLRAGDLFDENVVDELAKADSNLSTLFSGRDFGEDILGSIQPQLSLVVSRQEFTAGTPRPAIRLPAFALVTEMREPEKMRRELRRTFQSLIGFLNVVGAMNGQPQLELDMENLDEAELVTATFIPELGKEESEEAPINFNFSPSVGFVGKQFVVASTRGLARELVAGSPAAAGIASENSPTIQNTWAQADLRVLRDILSDNRNQLVAQNMLEEGNSRAEAETQIDLLMEILGVLRELTVQLATNDQQLRFEMALKLQTE